MLCAVDYIFDLLCAINSLQPMKKFVFSVASRATFVGYKLSRVALGTRMIEAWRLSVRERDAKVKGPTRLLFVEKEIMKYSKKP